MSDFLTLKKNAPKTRFSAGFTLMEVLITLFVMSIGFLGLAKLQIEGLHYAHQSYLRGQATFLAADIIDRMRANRTLAESDGDSDFDYRTDFTSTTLEDITCTGAVSDCTPAQTAIFDLFEWKTALNRALPDGGGAISRTTGTQRKTLTITVRWKAGRSSDPDDYQQLSVVTEL
ncbi:type IV pilus modification protein PilV [Magnetococcales bacterium HHB-1]